MDTLQREQDELQSAIYEFVLWNDDLIDMNYLRNGTSEILEAELKRMKEYNEYYTKGEDNEKR